MKVLGLSLCYQALRDKDVHYMRRGLKGILPDQCANRAFAVDPQRLPGLVLLGDTGDSEKTCASLVLFIVGCL